jgi:lipopolysaccharide export system permease protein
LELIQPFVINLVFFTFVFLMTKILEITNLVVNYRVGLVQVVLMLIYAIPSFLVFVIPMSVMMAVLLTFLRMSADNEITALKAGGISLYQLVAPVALFCLIGTLITGLMTVVAGPKGRIAAENLTHQAMVSSVEAGLRERVFNDGFEGVMLYVSKVDLKQKRLVDIFIEDQRDKDTVTIIVAPLGEVVVDAQRQIVQLRLINGMINHSGLKSRGVHSIHFDTYDIILELKKDRTGDPNGIIDPRRMDLAELQRHIDGMDRKNPGYYTALMEFHKKFAIPFACVSLGLLAMPLGVQVRVSRKSAGLGLGLGFFLIYYLMLSAGFVFGEKGIYPPALGMWMPNALMGAAGIYLIIGAANERRPLGADGLARLLGRLKMVAGHQPPRNHP